MMTAVFDQFAEFEEQFGRLTGFHVGRLDADEERAFEFGGFVGKEVGHRAAVQRGANAGKEQFLF